MPLPNFLIIGAQKSASRWLRISLGEHPDVYTADAILHFFNRESNFSRGTDWYSAQFEGWQGESKVGEASPTYMLLSQKPARSADRIAETLPGVKLIAILRNPVDRTYSGFVHHMWRGRIPPETNLNEMVHATPPEEEPYQLIAGSWYARSLAPYFERFGDDLLVVLQDDVKQDAPGVYRTALEHIGARNDFEPDGLTEVLFSRVPPEGSEYRTEDGKRRKLTPQERADLFTLVEADVDKLEGMIGRDLSIWRPS